jgi:hypothetical protein
MRLQDAARVVRSKNAGPTEVTLDIMFDDDGLYERALRANALSPTAIADRYGVPSAAVIPYPAARAIKIVIPRHIIAGSPGDSDVYGAQQHRRLLDLEI